MSPGRQIRLALVIMAVAPAAACGHHEVPAAPTVAQPAPPAPASEPVASSAPASPRQTAGTCPSKPQLAEALPDDIQVVGWSGGIHCAHGWAAVGVDVADPHAEIDGQPAVNTELHLFRTEGDRWVEVSREKSCEAGAVPAKIEDLACNAS